MLLLLPSVSPLWSCSDAKGERVQAFLMLLRRVDWYCYWVWPFGIKHAACKPLQAALKGYLALAAWYSSSNFCSYEW